MINSKIERLLEKLRERLKNEPAFDDNFTGEIVLNMQSGGLSGTVTITKEV